MRVYKINRCKRVHSLRFSPDSRQIIVAIGVEAGSAERLVWIDLQGGEPVIEVPFYADSFAGTDFDLSYDQTRLIVAESISHSDPRQAEIIHWCNPLQQPVTWHPHELNLTWPPWLFSMVPGPMALAPDGNRFLLSLGYQWLNDDRGSDWRHFLIESRLDSIGRYEPLNFDSLNIPSHMIALAIAPNGKHWAASHNGVEGDARISLFAGMAAPTRVTGVPGSRAGRLTFSPEGRFLAATVMRNVALYDAETLELRGWVEGNRKMVNDVAFSPSSHMLLTVTNDGKVRVWETSTAKLVMELDWNIGPLTAVACSPDGLLHAAGGSKGRVVVWDAE